MLMRYTLIYGVGRGIPGVVNFMTIAIYTRMLQPDDYGYYALMIASVGLWNTVLFEWLRLGLLRLYPGHAERPHALLATLACGFGAIAVLAAIATAVAVVLVPVSPLLASPVPWSPVLATSKSGFVIVQAASRTTGRSARMRWG